MQIGQLYDQTIADYYDRDELGLLSGARGLAVRQIEAHLSGRPAPAILDLAAGTGESLVAMQRLFPEAALHGIDLSDKMLAIAKTKLAFRAIHDDVAHAGRHVAPESVDLVLMHFLTTFIDGAQVVADTARLLKSGGYFSIVSTTYEAFARIHELGLKLFPEEAIRQVAPAPRDGEEIASFLRGAGLEVVAIDEFEKPVRFETFQEGYAFGLQSGFFTHVFEGLDSSLVAAFEHLENAFPLEDRYKAAIVLARKP